MQKAIIAVSFGTTHADAEESCIRPVERALAEAYPDWDIHRAWTSRIIARRLAARSETLMREGRLFPCFFQRLLII